MKEYIQRLLQTIDYEYFTFYQFQKGIGGAVTTYPEEWCNRYIGNRYDKFDIVPLRANALPFYWREADAKDQNTLAQNVFKEAQDFGINQGVSAPIYGENKSGLLSVIVHKSEHLGDHAKVELGQKLQLVGTLCLLKEKIDTDSLNDPATTFQYENALRMHETLTSKSTKLIDVLNNLRYGRLLQENKENERAQDVLKEACDKLEDLI